ncbi:MAG: LON peptidase substrate-binding domain-containing protein, partial [Anaerolineae bacterium]|nr:LON peptidase substrate-binding domain-containing protein [Anaerolineae bacterium]
MLSQKSKIPLFPLELVLFPGMMLPLHIFEPRYKIMIKECISAGQPFGVVLTKPATPGSDKVANPLFDEIYNIGTTAHITAVEHLDDGRMNLITVGQDRFIINDIELGENKFFIGQVDPFPMKDDNPNRVESLMKKLRPMVQRYIDHLAQASGEDLSEAKLPTDPTALAYLAGTAMQGPLPDKQKLLSAKSLTSLIANA